MLALRAKAFRLSWRCAHRGEFWKAGKTGTLRSLHQFMVTHNSAMAVRLNLDLPSFGRAEGALPAGTRYSYPLLSLPVYMVEQVERLARAVVAAQTD